MDLFEDAFNNVRKYILASGGAIASNLGVDYVYLAPAPRSDMIRAAVILNDRVHNDDIKLQDIVMLQPQRQLDFVFSKLRWLAVKASSASESPFIPLEPLEPLIGNPTFERLDAMMSAVAATPIAYFTERDGQVRPWIPPDEALIDELLTDAGKRGGWTAIANRIERERRLATLATLASANGKELDAMINEVVMSAMPTDAIAARLAPASVSDVPEEPKFANRFEAVVAEMEDDE